MKQMPVESFLPATGRPASVASRAHLALGESRQRHAGRRQLRLRQAVQKIGLVLVAVGRAQQMYLLSIAPERGVMAGGDGLRAKRQRMLLEHAELDLAVAQNVRIRRAPAPVLGQEMREHLLAVFGGEVHHLHRDVERLADGLHVGDVGLGRAVAEAVVVLPVLHEKAKHVVPGALEQQRRDGRIHATGQADHHPRRWRQRQAEGGVHQACASSDSGWRAPAR